MVISSGFISWISRRLQGSNIGGFSPVFLGTFQAGFIIILYKSFLSILYSRSDRTNRRFYFFIGENIVIDFDVLKQDINRGISHSLLISISISEYRQIFLGPEFTGPKRRPK